MPKCRPLDFKYLGSSASLRCFKLPTQASKALVVKHDLL